MRPRRGGDRMGRRTRAKTRAGTGAAAPTGRTKAARKGKPVRRSRVRWLGWLVAAALAVVVLRALPGADSGAVARVGAEAPALQVKTLDGQKLSLAELRG